MFNVTLHGEAEAIAALEAMPGSVRHFLEVEVTSLAIMLREHIVRDKLAGQVLNRVSGDLSRSIQEEAPIIEGESVLGKVYSAGDVKYAAVHEYGFHGTVTVKEHLRHMVFGHEVEPFMVGPYAMKVNLPERSFMRSSLADKRQTIIDRLQAAAGQGLRAPFGGPA
jgi:phage gpG-like protein